MSLRDMAHRKALADMAGIIGVDERLMTLDFGAVLVDSPTRGGAAILAVTGQALYVTSVPPRASATSRLAYEQIADAWTEDGDSLSVFGVDQTWMVWSRGEGVSHGAVDLAVQAFNAHWATARLDQRDAPTLTAEGFWIDNFRTGQEVVGPVEAGRLRPARGALEWLDPDFEEYRVDWMFLPTHAIGRADGDQGFVCIFPYQGGEEFWNRSGAFVLVTPHPGPLERLLDQRTTHGADPFADFPVR